MKKLIFILVLLPVLVWAGMDRLNEETEYPYWQDNILSGDPNQLEDYMRVFVNTLQDMTDDIIVDLNLLTEVESGITAKHTGEQGDEALTAAINEISTVANASDAVTLPSATIGRTIIIINNGANTLEIWPAKGDNAGTGVDTAITLDSGSNRRLVSYDTTNWEPLRDWSGPIVLSAGTATAGTAPLKFTSGTALTIPEVGALEFHDNRLYLTNVAVRRSIDRTSDVTIETTTVSNTTDETTIYTAVIGANALKVGNYIELNCSGIISTATASDDITINSYVGNNLITSFNPAIGNVTNGEWFLDLNLTVRTVGITGTIASYGYAEIDDSTDTISELDTLNTTAASDITITVVWDNAKAGNTISIYQGVAHWSN